MIIYLTGVPGSGKTLRTMWWLNQDGYKDRPIYSNINGEGSERPAGHLPLPDDWTEVPDGAMVVVDEAQHRWPQRGPSKAIPPEVSALDTHRHRGVDFIITTQRPTGVDHHVRGLVGRHEHMRRKMGLEGAMVQMSEEAFDPNDANQVAKADQFAWKFPKEYYGQYKSSVEHTGAYKFRMNKKLLRKLALPGALILGVVSLFGYRAATGGGIIFGSDEANAPKPAQAQPAQQPASPPPPQVYARRVKYQRRDDFADIRGCISTPKTCRCFDGDGYQLVMDEAACRNASLGVRYSSSANGSDHVGASKRTTPSSNTHTRTHARGGASGARPRVPDSQANG